MYRIERRKTPRAYFCMRGHFNAGLKKIDFWIGIDRESQAVPVLSGFPALILYLSDIK